MRQSETRWIRDVPSDPMMQRQWSQVAIPWCTTHDASCPRGAAVCWAGLKLNETERCVIHLDGSEHKWWRDASE